MPGAQGAKGMSTGSPPATGPAYEGTRPPWNSSPAAQRRARSPAHGRARALPASGKSSPSAAARGPAGPAAGARHVTDQATPNRRTPGFDDSGALSGQAAAVFQPSSPYEGASAPPLHALVSLCLQQGRAAE